MQVRGVESVSRVPHPCALFAQGLDSKTAVSVRFSSSAAILLPAIPMTDSVAALKSAIEHLSTSATVDNTSEARRTFLAFRSALTRGEVRATEKVDGRWAVNAWVKQGILLGFRLGELKEMSGGDVLSFVDKDTFPARRLTLADRIRLVPGGSSIREGAYVAPSVICMPPMFINVGAYVDEGTMVDSHALVGSCAQIGKRVHLSAAAQVGGVLEPINAVPVIIEDDVLVGGNCGIYEGTLVRSRAVLGAGTILTRSTPIYDIVRGEVYRATDEKPLEVPEGAVVVPGSRAVSKGKAAEWNLSLYTPVIVKYRDEKTDQRIELEEWLR
jgi:2,3,4,5-tetrahydropyridine-2,6-dicarboxylate N-succinyltransferase